MTSRTIKYLFLGFFVVLSFALNAQQIPLEEALKKLSAEKDISLIYVPEELPNCSVFYPSSVTSINELFQTWKNHCSQLSIENKRGIYKIGKIRQVKVSNFSSIVVDAQSKEPLPNAYIATSECGYFIADKDGRFSFKCNTDTILLNVEHLGYVSFAKQITINTDTLALQAMVAEIGEVLIQDQSEKKMIQLGQEAGKITMNYKVANGIPGNSNNSIYNLIRMQPGILASGEQTQDYIIWGSYKGQSLIRYDGFTLFNISNLDDNIGAINPLMVQDVTVYKAAYNAHIGGRVGGVVDILGRKGQKDKVHLDINLNPLASSGRLNIPLMSHSLLQLAYRQNITQTVTGATVIQSAKDIGTNQLSNEYSFKDWNAKWNTQIDDKNSIQLSLMSDRNDLEIKSADGIEDEKGKFFVDNETNRSQNGGSLIWNRYGYKLDHQLTISRSNLSTEIERSLITQFEDDSDKEDDLREESFSNSVEEKDIRWNAKWSSSSKMYWNGGLSILNNTTNFERELDQIGKANLKDSINRISSFIKTTKFLGKISISPGIRIDAPIESRNVYFQPRLTGKVYLSDMLNLTFGTGLYNQFLTENSTIDELGNYQYYWRIIDDRKSTIVGSFQNALGIFYEKSNWSFSLEGYYKTGNGLTRDVFSQVDEGINTYSGTSINYGLDFYLRSSINASLTSMLSYSWSKSLEQFSYFSNQEYQLAPHDQRHEFKLVALQKLDPFYISASTVYGSGFPSLLEDAWNKSLFYSRTDISLRFKKKIKQKEVELGFSILNIFNRENIRYNNFIQFAESDRIFTKAIGRTFNAFVNFRL